MELQPLRLLLRPGQADSGQTDVRNTPSCWGRLGPSLPSAHNTWPLAFEQAPWDFGSVAGVLELIDAIEIMLSPQTI